VISTIPLRRSGGRGGEDQSVALPSTVTVPSTCSGALLDEEELPSGVIDAGPVQPEHDLQRETRSP